MDLHRWNEEKTRAVQELLTELNDHRALSREEYEELVQDILDVEHIYGKLQTEEDRIVVAKIVEGLKALAGLL
jgi:hypothetical protein